jgi:hypothetical protein
MCVDQGFPRSGDAAQILVGPISRRQARQLAANLREYLIKISKGISHCMVMIGSEGTILMKMMYMIIKLVVFILMSTGFIFT